MVFHARSQAHRAALSRFHHLLFSLRRCGGDADAAGTDPSPWRALHLHDLQQALHAAWRDHGLVLPHSLDSQRAGKFSDPTHDRRAGHGLPAAQPDQLVRLHVRRPVRHGGNLARRRRHGLDVLHALQQHLFKHLGHCDGGGDLHQRVLLHFYRPQFHRYRPQAARARHDLVSAAAPGVDALLDQPHFRPRHARSGDHADAGHARAGLRHRHFRSAQSAATRCSSSISSGSTRTRPFISWYSRPWV